MSNEQAKNAVRRIIWDLTDRHGIADEWNLIDEETQDEIKAKWAAIIVEAMTELTNRAEHHED